MSKRAALVVAIVVGGGLWAAALVASVGDRSEVAGRRAGAALADSLLDHPLIVLACVAVVAVAMIVVSQREA